MTATDAGRSGPPCAADVEEALGHVGESRTVGSLPPDLGSNGRSHVYVLDDLVVKFDQSPNGRRVLRERAALDLLATSGLPVPSLLGWGDQPRFHWLVMTRLPGRPPDDAKIVAHRPSPELAEDMGYVTGRLHNGPVPPDFGTWIIRSRPLIEDHRLMNEAVAGMARDACLLAETALTRLADLLGTLRASLESAPTVPVLAHRDIQARNVLVDDHGRLCGLLDFETAGGGDPAEDFSRLGLDWTTPQFAAFQRGYIQSGRTLDVDAAHRVAYHVLSWVLVIYGYLGVFAPEYLPSAKTAWERIEAGERPPMFWSA